jgi:5-methyltetrahydrofolate--homocysteine methyltransferase
MTNMKLLDELSGAIVSGEVKKTRKLTELLLIEGVPTDRIMEALLKAKRVADDKYTRKEYFEMDVVAAASARKEAFKLLQPHLKVEQAQMKAKVVIGSLKGNIQGLGKDVVAATLKSAGFEVVDLGVNVSPSAFVDAAAKERAHVIAISISMAETVPFLKELTDILQRRNLHDNMKIVIGGSAVSEKTREEYGVDAYAKDASDCVKKVEALLAKTKTE